MVVNEVESQSPNVHGAGSAGAIGDKLVAGGHVGRRADQVIGVASIALAGELGEHAVAVELVTIDDVGRVGVGGVVELEDECRVETSPLWPGA